MALELEREVGCMVPEGVLSLEVESLDPGWKTLSGSIKIPLAFHADSNLNFNTYLADLQ
jgi:hypothetical protein